MDLRIDPHVHCRDWEQKYKSTIKQVFEIARKQGVEAVFDMPNTKPAILAKKDVRKRMSTANEEGCPAGYYLYIGVTEEQEQIREAIDVALHHPKVVGIKMYADSEIADENSQRLVFKELADANYDGVLAVHAEKKSLFRMDLWNPECPASWNLARPPEAEIASVQDMIKFAKGTGFKGKLYFVHVTNPQVVDIVQKAKQDMEVYCAVTPHHATLSTADMKGPDGLMLKVNSPLREQEMMRGLRRCILENKIDAIETDHAPHTKEEKMGTPYASGIRSLLVYREFLIGLGKDGASEELIRRMTSENILKIFDKVKV